MSDKQISTADALELIAESINEPVDDVQLDVPLEDLEGWDSMGVLLLMAELDEQFGITIEEDRIKAFEKVSDIVSVMKEAGAIAA